MPRVHIVIPARLASTRLPEKLLLRAGGKSILQHTYEAACTAQTPDAISIAVDHPRLADEAKSFGANVVMTSPDCPSGTDRIAEVARQLPSDEIFVNVQGDEPEIDPKAIDMVASLLVDAAWADMSTAARPIRDRETLDNPNCVKAVLGHSGRALYFSRAAVPFSRDDRWNDLLQAEPPVYWHHLGLYAYRREFLQWFSGQPTGKLEQTEKLEQLRVLELGKQIIVGRIDAAPAGIDTQADYDAFVKRLASR